MHWKYGSEVQYVLSLLITPLLWHWPKHKWRPAHTFFSNTNQTLITWGSFLVFLFYYKLKCTFLNNKKSVLRDIWQDTSGKVSFSRTMFAWPAFPSVPSYFLHSNIDYSFPLQVPCTIFLPKIFFLILFWVDSWRGEGQRGYRSYITRVRKQRAERGTFWMLKSFLVPSVNCVFSSNSCQKRCEQEQFNLCPRFVPEVCLLCTHRTLQHTDDGLQGRVQHQDIRTSPSCDHSKADTKILQLSYNASSKASRVHNKCTINRNKRLTGMPI